MRKYKESKRKQLIIVVFMSVIMVFSVFGIIFYGFNPESKLKYKKFNFNRKDYGWSILINKKETVFDYFPTEVTDIKIEENVIDRISNSLEIDATYDTNVSYADDIATAQYSMQEIIGSHFNIYIRLGVTTDDIYNFPIITCNESTDFIPVIYFKESNETKVYLDGNCIIAEIKDSYDAARIKDRLLYGLFGIIEG